MLQRVSALEGWRALSDDRYDKNEKRLDKIDVRMESMDGKLDTLIERNIYQDGGSEARGKLGKGVVTVLGLLLSGSGLTYLISWWQNRGHP